MAHPKIQPITFVDVPYIAFPAEDGSVEQEIFNNLLVQQFHERPDIRDFYMLNTQDYQLSISNKPQEDYAWYLLFNGFSIVTGKQVSC